MNKMIQNMYDMYAHICIFIGDLQIIYNIHIFTKWVA